MHWNTCNWIFLRKIRPSWLSGAIQFNISQVYGRNLQLATKLMEIKRAWINMADLEVPDKSNRAPMFCHFNTGITLNQQGPLYHEVCNKVWPASSPEMLHVAHHCYTACFSCRKACRYQYVLLYNTPDVDYSTSHSLSLETIDDIYVDNLEKNHTHISKTASTVIECEWCTYQIDLVVFHEVSEVFLDLGILKMINILPLLNARPFQ